MFAPHPALRWMGINPWDGKPMVAMRGYLGGLAYKPKSYPLLLTLIPYFLKDSMPSFSELLDSARNGDSGSQCDLAMMYSMGQEVDEDNEEAAYWWTKAAQQGHVASQYNLANIYYRGEGVDRDYAQAARWYRKAAEHAHSGILIDFSDYYSASEVRNGIMTSIQAAFINLGRCYGNGHGVAKDDVEAYAFYNLGCSMGGNFGEVAQKNIGTLERKMGRDEVAEGQRRTRELKAYYCKIVL